MSEGTDGSGSWDTSGWDPGAPGPGPGPGAAPPPPPPGQPGYPPPMYGGPPGFGHQGPGMPPGMPPGYGYPYYRARPTNSKATTSMVLGIVSLVSCWFFTGIPAIIIGNRAKKEIEASGGVEDGEGMAQAGVIMGWIATVLSLLGLAFYVAMIAIILTVGETSDSRLEPTGPAVENCNDFDEYTYNDC